MCGFHFRFDGAEWRDTRSGVSNIRLARIGAAGGVGGEIAVAASGSNQFTPDVACISASNCLVTWNEPVGGLQTVRGSVVNPSNGAAGAPFTISTAVAGVDQGAASVATNGTNYFVAWEANVQATLASNVKGANVTGAGVASAPFDVSANGGSDEYTAQVAYNGAQYVVGYTSFATDEDALAQLVSPGGGNVGGAIVIGSGAGDQSQPAFAANGSTLLAAYYNQNNISGAPLNGATVGSAFTIAGAATSEDSPKVSFGSGSNYYVVYNDRTTAGPPSTWTAQGTRATTSAAVAPTVDLSVAAQICDSVTVNFNPASPQTVGTAVTVTGNASCAGGATPQYEFWLNNGSGWMVAQAYSASSTFNWNTTAYAGATYQVLVRTRRVGSTAAYDAQVSANYTLTGGTGICNALTASAAPPSPQAVGTMVTVTGAATCTNAATPEYQFWLNNGGGWNVVQNYGASTTFNWNTGSYPGASYSVLVRTRRAGSTASYEGQTSFSYTLTGGSGVCNALTTAAAPPSPQPVGTSVTISGTATCTNSAIPQYQFYTLAPGGFWHLEQDFSTASSFTWATSGLATGTYTLLVRTRASGTNSVYDSQQSRLYTLQ